jgi:hypothetical protein
VVTQRTSPDTYACSPIDAIGLACKSSAMPVLKNPRHERIRGDPTYGRP